MKTRSRLQIISMLLVFMILVLITGLLFPESVFADKMNDKTQDLVISKLQHVSDAMDHNDSSWLPTQQRLADVLAERARSRFMLEVESNCDNCKGSKEDRKQAIKIYQNLTEELPINEHGPLLFQLGHLYEIGGEPDQAITLFETIIKDAKKKSIAKEIVTRSQSEVGDLLFKKGKFKDALGHYTTALKDNELENKNLITYNLAWCEFNTGKLNAAISTLEKILNHPEEITRNSVSGNSYDVVFHADIVRDLGTFYSRRNITTNEILTYEGFTPKDSRKELILNFAQEADRVGQKQAAHDILNRYLEIPDLTKSERLEAFVRLAQINYDRGEVTESTLDFAKASAAFKANDCDDKSKCQELQKTMKRYVTELHRSKKTKPDQDLLNAYMTYVKTFPNDKEMIQRGSQVAMALNNYPMAIALYRGISESDSFSKDEQNEALLNEVGVAEKSQDAKILAETYAHFLKYGTKNEKYFQIRYQQAYLLYTQKKLKESTDLFKDLAFDKAGPAELRKKSADLALDGLAQLKRDEELKAQAEEYSELFPVNKSEYLGIARKALMNQLAAVSNNPKSTTSELKAVFKAVLKTSLDGASAKERKLFYSNLSIIAQKLNEDEVYINAISALINLPEITDVQKQKYITQLVGHFERKLDFKNAYKFTLKLGQEKMTTKGARRELEVRLGTLADLADSPEYNPTIHYKKAIELGLTGNRSLVLRTRLVLLSENPARELRLQANELKQKPELLNDTALLILAKSGLSTDLKTVLAMKELKNKSAAHFVEKSRFYETLGNFKERLSKSKIDQSNAQVMQKNIQQRMSLLKIADENLKKSLALKDITAEIYALNILVEENQRFVQDLAHLDIPRELNPAQRRSYLDSLKMKSKPFISKAIVARQRILEIWNSSRGLAELAAEYRKARPEIQALLSKEIHILEQVPGNGFQKSELLKAVNSPTVSLSTLQAARNSVSDSPESLQKIENLKVLELKVGHPLMPSYLEDRLIHIQKGIRL